MFVYTNLVITIAQMLQTNSSALLRVVIASAVLSWVEPNPYNPIVRFIYLITEPVFDWVREHIPVFFGGIDFSPMIVILGIWFIQSYSISGFS